MKRVDISLGCILLLLCGVVYVQTRSFPSVGRADMGFGPAFVPRIITLVLAFLATLIIYVGWAERLRPQAYVAVLNPRVLMVLGVIAAYILLLGKLGFWLTTPFFVGATALLFGGGLSLSIKTGVISTAISYCVFRLLLKVYLPSI